MNDTEVDITIVAGEIHELWQKSETGAELQGAALRTTICRKVNSEDGAIVNRVVQVMVRKRAEFIAKSIGLAEEKITRLGAGGFGSVFPARMSTWSWHKKSVALKLLNPLLLENVSPPGGQDPQAGASPTPGDQFTAEARFRQEFEILNQLSHPGLPKVYNGGEIKRQPFYVMQHGGTSLWAPDGYSCVTAGKSAAVEKSKTLAQFAADLLEVLVYVHAHNIAHRDLKPSNILVFAGSNPDRQRPMLIDFGIAQDRRPAARQDTKTGQEPGGGDHWSESPKPPSYQQDARPGDIYSFGRVLEFLLDPKRIRDEVLRASSPRPNSTPSEPAAAPAPDRAAIPPAVNSDQIRNRLTEIAAKCCLPVSDGRYPTAAAVLEDVLALLHPPREVPIPNPPVPIESAPIGYRFNWSIVLLFLTFLALAVCFILLPRFVGIDDSRKLMITEAKLLREEAEKTSQGDHPEDVEAKYRKSLQVLDEAHERWPEDLEILEWIGRNRHSLGQECERKGLIKKAEKEYGEAIKVWEDLVKRDDSKDDFKRELARAYDDRGDVKLKDDGSGLSNERAAVDDYNKSETIRKALANKWPKNVDCQIQYIVAQTNFARLYFYSDRAKSLAIWKEVIKQFQNVRPNADVKDETKRQVRDLLALSLLDHFNGYLACLDPANLDPKQPQSPERDEALQMLKLAESLCHEAREAGNPVVASEIALGYCKIRLGLDTADKFPAQLEKLRTHIDSLPEANRTWPRGLFLEMVLEMRRSGADTKDWVADAKAFPKQLPEEIQVYSNLLTRWRAAFPTSDR